MGSVTLGSITITGVQSIMNTKTANVLPIPIPTGNSDETEVIDMLGVIRIITVTGTFAESTVAATKVKIDQIDALITGDQETISFSSDQTGTIDIMVGDLTTVWDVPGFKCEFTLKLIQGTQI